MKFVTRILVLVGVVFLVVGCGKKTQTISVPGGGSVEVTHDGKDASEVKVTTQEGTMEMSTHNKVDLSTLGIPIYPGLSAEEGGGSLSMSGGKDNQQMQMVHMVTSDPQEKVAEFYKEKLKDKKPDVMDMNHGGTKMTHIMVKEDNGVIALVISSDDKGKTTVTYTKSTK